MRPLSRREGIWIEPIKLDLPEDVLYYSDYISNSPLAFSEETVESLVLSDSINYIEFGESEDTLLLNDVPSSDYLIATTDTILAYETLWLTGVEAPVLSETLIASDSVDSFYSTVTVDTVAVSDTLTGRLTITGSLTDTLTASDSIAAELAGVSADTAIVSDSLATAVTTASVDTLTIADIAGAQLSTSAATVNALIVRDEIGYGSIQSTENTIVVSDSIAGTVSVASPVLSDTVTISETLAGPVTIYAAMLTDTLVASDTITGKLALVGVLSDTVLFGDTLADAAYQILVVANAETGAVSTYTMTPVVAGLAEYLGTLYLASPDGLYAMDATEDEDGEVVWTLRTGFSNLGSDLLKRVLDANILGRTEGNTLLKVVTARSGQKQEYHYQLPMTTRDAYRDGVTKIGRGLQSVYWQFAMQGAGPAEIDQIKLLTEPLSRRR